MADETMKQGIAGASYDTSKVFDPSKQQKKTTEAPAIAGLAASPTDGFSTTAGSNYYKQNQIPSTSPVEPIAGYKPGTSPQGGTPPQNPTQAIAGPLATSVNRPQVQPIAGFSIAGSGASAPGGNSLISTPKAIAGITPDNLQTLGKMQESGMSADGVRRMDAINQRTIAGIGTSGNSLLDDKGRTYNEQVAHADKVNAINALPVMSGKETAAQAILNDPRASSITRRNAAQDLVGFNSRMESAKTLLGNQQAQTIAGIKAQGDRYSTDQQLAGVKYNADAHVTAAGITGDANTAKAQQAALGKQQEQGQKDYTDRVKGLMSNWSKLNLPTDVAPKLNYYAKLHAEAENPNGKLFMMPPNRQGGQYAVLPKAYEPHYQKLLQHMPHNDAAAKVYAVAQKNGHAIDMPDFNRFQTKRDAVNGG